MPRILPLQSGFRVFIAAPGKANVDVTDFVDTPVTLTLDENRLATLSLSMKDPEKHSEYLRMGYTVLFYGGTLEGINFKDVLEGTNFKLMFSGSVRFLYMDYREDGKKYLTVTCIDYAWSRSAYTNNFFAYPSPDCKRAWAAKNTIKLSDIVKGVAREIGMEVEVTLQSDTEYYDFEPAVQKNKSDWAFLRQLAHDNSCYVWTAVEGSKTVIKFCDKRKAINQKNRVEFVWLDRKGHDFIDLEQLGTGDGSSEKSKLKDYQKQLLSVTVEENPQMIGSNITVLTDWDESTGESVERLVNYDETKDEIIYYKLDQEKIDDMEKTEEGAEELDRIMSMGPTDIPPEVFMRFYIPEKVVKGSIKAIDSPYLGITVNAKSRGDVNVMPFQSYVIRGISRYSSLSNKSGTYFMKAITYTWDDSGFTMDMTFLR